MASKQLRRGMSTVPRLTVPMACEQLRQGRGVAFPTPCGYGWAIDPFQVGAEAIIALLKPRRNQPLGLIAAHLEQVQSVAELPTQGTEFLARWPDELSLILRGKAGLPPLICSPEGGVSIRIPKAPLSRNLAAHYGAPLTATSLNRSGEAPLSNVSELQTLPEGVIAGYLPGQAGAGAPSTLVDLLGNSCRLIRRGSVDVSDLVED